MNTERAEDNRLKVVERDDTLDIREVAEALKVHPVTVRRLIAAGRFPRPVRVGAALRIRRSDLRAWLDKGGAPDAPKIETRSAPAVERRIAQNRAPLSVRADAGRRVLSGYAAVFYRAGDAGTEYELSPGVFERINPRAFSRTINSRADVLAAFNHDINLLLGRTSSGTLRLSTDARGLRYEIDLPDTPTGSEVYELARRGDVAGASFSFSVRGKRDFIEGERTIRELLDVELYELGPVVSPAYTATTAGAATSAGAAVGDRAKADADMIAVTLALMEMEMLD